MQIAKCDRARVRQSSVVCRFSLHVNAEHTHNISNTSVHDSRTPFLVRSTSVAGGIKTMLVPRRFSIHRLETSYYNDCTTFCSLPYCTVKAKFGDAYTFVPY